MMGYTTRFQGTLRFNNEVSVPQLRKLKSMMGEDCRNHKEWNAPDLYYIDLDVTETLDGLEWSGAEKTYDLDKLVNVVLREMWKEFPEFGLEGVLTAQGEDVEDRWELYIGAEGLAKKRKLTIPGAKVKCPHCEESFYYDPAATA